MRHILHSAVSKVRQFGLGFLGNRGGGRRHNGTSLLVRKELERDAGTDHLRLPLEGNLEQWLS